MAETAASPKLEINRDTQSYAPLSWVAVLAAVVAIVFIVVFASLAYTSFIKKQPLLIQSLLIMPLVTFILAFVAKQQVRNAEGTRTGNLGSFNLIGFAWWVGIVGGLGYFAYLFAVEFAVRKDVESTFVEWSNSLKDLNPDDPSDPNLYLAFHKCVPPAGRKNLSAKDVRQMDIRFMNQLSGFKQSDIIRICQRNRGEVKFVPQGLEKWEHTPKSQANNEAITDAKMSCLLVCPEGEYEMSITMKGFMDEAGRRDWMFMPSAEGMIKGARLTNYGRRVYELESSAAETAKRLFGFLSIPGSQEKIYMAFMTQDNSVAVEENLFKSTFARMAVVGGVFWNDPLISNSDKAFFEKYFTPILPADAPKLPEEVKKLNEDMRKRFAYCWNTNRIRPPKSMIRENTDSNPLLVVQDDVIMLKYPIELVLQGGDTAANTARGKMILECRNPEVLAEVKKAREAAKTEKPVSGQIDGWTYMPSNWRLVRFESDLKAVPATAQPGGRSAVGPGGPLPGMEGL